MSGYFGKATRALAMFVVVVLLVSAVPLALPEADVAQNAAAAEYYVKVGSLQDFSNWNPLNIEFVSDYVACFLMYSTLFQYNEDWEGPVNDLATSYYTKNWPGGNLTLYVNITENAYFRNIVDVDSKSHQLTASDVAFTINLILENEGGAWDLYLEDLTGANATETFQVAIDVSFPKATILDNLVWIPILPEYIWYNEPNVLGAKKPDWLVGSGPFVYNSSLKTQWYRFTAVPETNYHGSIEWPVGDPEGARVVSVDGIVYRYYSDVNLMVSAMNSGELDAMDISGAPALYVDEVSDTFTKMTTSEMGIIDIAINAIPMEFRKTTGGGYGQGNTLLLDKWVREAIMMSLNKDYVSNTIMRGLTTQAYSVLSTGYWQADIQGKLSYDTTAAKNLLLAHGYANLDTDEFLEATEDAYPVIMGWADVGTELNFRLQAPDTDPSYEAIGTAWVGWARDAGIYFDYSTESEAIMTNNAWYKAAYDVWVWSWYWGPEPLSNLAVWSTSQLKPGGDNCQMPMGPWYFNEANSSTGVAYSAYDENFTAAEREFDVAARKVIVDKLQQWVYDSRTETPPIYPAGLYVVSDARYTGWGNWTEHIGRSVSSDLPWVWFDLVPTGGNQMPEFTLPLDPQYQFVVDEPQTFTVTIRDPDGDQINVTWNFGDGATATDTATTGTLDGVTFTQTHTYTTLAVPPNGLEMNVTASDGNSPNNATSYATVYVFPLPDAVPELVTPILSDPYDRAYKDQNVTWSAGARDAETGGGEGTGLRFTWDWDDNTYTSTLYQPTTKGAEILDSQVHNWTVPGWYNIVLYVSDESTWPGHNVSWTIPYEIVLNQPPEAPDISTITANRNVLVDCWATSSDVDGDELRFTWVWDDGTFNVTQAVPARPGAVVASEVMHQWTAQGTFPVTVWVDDLTEEAGHNVSATIDAVISGPAADVPPSSLGLLADPNPAYPDEAVVFNASAVDTNSDPLDFYVEFGDGTGAVGSTSGGTTVRQYVGFDHVYDSVGTFTVTLWVSDGTNNVSKAITLEVKENSPPWLILPSQASASYNVTFTLTPARVKDNDTDPLVVTFDWGDGSVSTGALPNYAGTHIFEVVGELNVTVYVDDGTGLAGHNVSGEVPVLISENFKPTIDGEITVTPDLDLYQPDEEITFNVTIRDYEGDLLNLTVDFGDDTDPMVIENIEVEPNNATSILVHHTFTKGKSTPYAVTFVVDDGMMAYHSVKTWNSRTVEVEVEKEGGTANLAIYLALALVAIVVIIVLLWVMMKRKKPASDQGGMEGMKPPVAEPPAPPKQ